MKSEYIDNETRIFNLGNIKFIFKIQKIVEENFKDIVENANINLRFDKARNDYFKRENCFKEFNYIYKNGLNTINKTIKIINNVKIGRYAIYANENLIGVRKTIKGAKALIEKCGKLFKGEINDKNN